MKIIIGAFDKVDIKLLSYENLFHHMHYRILQKALKLKSVKKIAKKFFKKSSNLASVPICLAASRKSFHAGTSEVLDEALQLLISRHYSYLEKYSM